MLRSLHSRAQVGCITWPQRPSLLLQHKPSVIRCASGIREPGRSGEPSTISRGPGASAPHADLKDYQHPVDTEQFRRMGYQVVDMICDYMSGLDKQRPVKPDVEPNYLRPQLPSKAPEQPEAWQDVVADFHRVIMPGVTHWQSPRFFAWFNANTSYPGILAEMLIASLNMIGFTWQSSPVSTELEMVMMDWLAQLCDLPPKFLSSSGTGGGVIQGTSSEAVVVAMLAARARALRGRPPGDALKLVAYASDQTHSAFQKAAMVLGLSHVRVLPTTAPQDWALQADALEAAITADKEAGLLPFYAVGTVGTTSSCAVDDLPAIGSVTRRHGVWLHVDAAYAGSAAVCPEQRLHFEGLDRAESYSFNPHKWLLTTFDCCAMWVDDIKSLREALSLTPVFLQAAGNVYDYKDWQLPLGRRFRSLKLWFVMRAYGGQGLQTYVRHHIALAGWLAQQVDLDSRFELAATQRFGLVCLRLAGADNETNKRLLQRINDTGNAFLSHTELDGCYTLRVAIGSATTQLRHVQELWQLVQATADEVLSESSNGAHAPPAP